MKFFQEHEKTLVKALIYGLIGGLYFSILFVSRTQEFDSGEGWTSFQELSVFEYVVKVSQISVSVSIGTVIAVLLYLAVKE